MSVGVYIPNWEKPKSCDECWAEYAYEICNRHSDCCPLVPVPPHGALMDRDDFFATCPELIDGYKAITDDLVVIPTEEGE